MEVPFIFRDLLKDRQVPHHLVRSLWGPEAHQVGRGVSRFTLHRRREMAARQRGPTGGFSQCRLVHEMIGLLCGAWATWMSPC